MAILVPIKCQNYWPKYKNLTIAANYFIIIDIVHSVYLALLWKKKEIFKVKYIFTLWSTIKSDSLTDGVMNVTILVEGFIITSNRVILSACLFL